MNTSNKDWKVYHMNKKFMPDSENCLYEKNTKVLLRNKGWSFWKVCQTHQMKWNCKPAAKQVDKHNHQDIRSAKHFLNYSPIISPLTETLIQQLNGN